MPREVTKDYNSRAFWNERFRRYGHTGDIDSVLYSYDQLCRLRAIDKALSRSKVQLDTGNKILDIGCGTGDLILSFLKMGLDITGIDFSDEVINYARGRFATNKNIDLHIMEAENIGFPSSSFDLVTSINVLQHIIDEKAFSRAIKNITRVVKLGRHILIMEFCPIKVKNKKPASFIVIRSKKEYVEAFEKNGCRLICEFGLPRIGVRLWRLIIERAIINLVKFLPCSRINLVKARVLKLAKPFDYFLAPFPPRFTDMRILIFEKRCIK